MGPIIQESLVTWCEQKSPSYRPSTRDAVETKHTASTKCKPSTMDKLHISLEFIPTHTIHGTDIFTYIYCSWFIYGFHVGI